MSGIEEKEEMEARIKREKDRILKNFSEISAEKRRVVFGLIDRAAFARIEIEELEQDILIYGWTEWFSQGEQEPYKRNRPEADHYHKLSASYQKIIKQLTDLLPKDEAKPPHDDGFEDFVNGKDDDI